MRITALIQIRITAETNPDYSSITGRNGTFRIDLIEIVELDNQAYINAKSANTGNLINGGLMFESAAMDKLAVGWCVARGITIGGEMK